MARYASGKKSNAMSDISGFKVKYKNLKTTWENLRVEPEEYDPKHPQLTPAKNVIDATALFKPRPDNDPDNVLFVVGYTQDWTVDPRTLPGIGMNGVGAVGNGVNSEINTINLTVTVSGVAGTGAIGTVVLNPTVVATGLAGTGAIGTVNLVLTLTETGVAGTGAIGGFGESGDGNMSVSITESGVAGTGAIGTESPQVLGWGQEGFGEGGWGE